MLASVCRHRLTGRCRSAGTRRQSSPPNHSVLPSRPSSTLSASSTNFATANIFAINVINGDVLAYAEDSVLTTMGDGDITLEAQNEATVDARVKGDATASSNAI